MDCKDESDEDSCNLIEINTQKYRNGYVPENPSGAKKLKINFWLDVHDIVDVNEPEVNHFSIPQL